MRLLPATYRIFLLPLHPDWVVYSELPPWYLPCWPFISFLSINTWPFHHHRQGLQSKQSQGYLTAFPSLSVPSEGFKATPLFAHPVLLHSPGVSFIGVEARLLLLLALSRCHQPLSHKLPAPGESLSSPEVLLVQETSLHTTLEFSHCWSCWYRSCLPWWLKPLCVC